jgi:glycosyltransferase involved in cell wall biosynthesis
MRQKLGIRASTPVIVFAARLHPQKGARQLLQAFEHLARRDEQVQLLIVGGGEDEASLRAQAQAGPYADRVHFTGAVDRAEMPALLALGQVFAFPSLRQEGLPMNVLEALACGLPAVVSEGMRPVFLPHLDLRYCAPKDPVALSDALEAALAANPPGAPAVSRLTPEYELTECAQAYARLLAQPKS